MVTQSLQLNGSYVSLLPVEGVGLRQMNKNYQDILSDLKKYSSFFGVLGLPRMC